MKKSLRIIPILLIVFLSSCGKSVPTSEEANDEIETAQEEVEQEAHSDSYTEEAALIELTKDELDEFTTYFFQDEYNGFLAEPYDDPSEIDWGSVFGFGAGLIEDNVSDKEIQDYLSETGKKSLYSNLYVIRKDRVVDYIRKHTGLDYVPDEIPDWKYIEKYDSFYREYLSSSVQLHYSCISGSRIGNDYVLRFHIYSEELPGSNKGKNFGRWADRILELTKEEESLIIKSNAIQWDDYSIPDQTFDVEFSHIDGPVRFITYDANSDETEIQLIKDGKYLMNIFTSIYSEGIDAHLNKIIAVGFFDFNSDSITDIVVMGDSNYGKYTLLYMGVATQWCFESFTDLSEEQIKDLGGDFTIAGVKKALLGDNQSGEYACYQDLYAQIARVYNIDGGKYEYDLVYADDDDIPELVVDYPGYGMSLYTYENGHGHCLMNRWAYGAMGNGGYGYFPRKGIYYNGNADYAGMIYYDTYMSKRGEGELKTDYWVKTINFLDPDGDGWPSEDDPFEEGAGGIEYHNETDKEMAEAEIKAVVELYNSYEMEQLCGVMNYEALLVLLEK